MEKLFPKENPYLHDKIEIRNVSSDGRINGFAHLR